MTKTALVLLPGILSDAAFWQNQVMELRDVCAPQVGDLSRATTISGMAQSILAAAPERFALAGLSLGGYVAFEILRQAPERVIRLALLDTHARTDPAESVPRRRAMIDRAGEGAFPDVVQALLPNVVHPSLIDSPVARDFVEMAVRSGADTFIRQLEAMEERQDSRAMLPSIRARTLVLCGDADRITPPELSQEMASAIPGAKLVLIEKAGHIPPMERPDAVNQAMREWLTAPL